GGHQQGHFDRQPGPRPGDTLHAERQVERPVHDGRQPLLPRPERPAAGPHQLVPGDGLGRPRRIDGPAHGAGLPRQGQAGLRRRPARSPRVPGPERPDQDVPGRQRDGTPTARLPDRQRGRLRRRRGRLRQPRSRGWRWLRQPRRGRRPNRPGRPGRRRFRRPRRRYRRGALL
ncbi:MAG: Single-stranded DNA-binding protein, partial [uncultured Thermomicrobiales bacterium]